ncbi:MAG: hypothetical protein ABIY70_21855 [Capsulimonas sp.]|uniref:hypothetical protein n=1 Tax=Capsulimonas sp. TaxID=2494211 RepID=UPI003263F512
MADRLWKRGAVAAGLIFCALHSAVAASIIPQYTYQDVGMNAPLGLNQAGDAYGMGILTPNGAIGTNINGGIGVFWSAAGGTVNLPHLPYANWNDRSLFSVAGMNDRGQIIGYSQVTGATVHPFLWTPSVDKKSGSMIDLGVLTRGVDQSLKPTAINYRGQVVGVTAGALPQHGFLYTYLSHDGVPGNVQMKDLGEFTPCAIDNFGRVYGIRNHVLAIYDAGAYVNPGLPTGFSMSNSSVSFYGRNASGDIYGTVTTPASHVFFVWIPTQNAATGVGRFVTITPGVAAQASAIPVAAIPRYDRLFIDPSGAVTVVYALDPYVGTLTQVNLGSLYHETGAADNPNHDAALSRPKSVDLANEIVGMEVRPVTATQPNFSPSGFLDHGGLRYALNALLAPGTSVPNINDAIGVNNSGAILAVGKFPNVNEFHGLMLFPSGSTPARPLTIASAQPQPVRVGSPSQYISIAGIGFQLGAVVGFDGKAIDAKVHAESLIVAFLPASKLVKGTHTILVRNPDHTSATISYVVNE